MNRKNLKLNIEPQQEGSLHWTAVDALWSAAGADCIQDAANILRARLASHSWAVYSGGHHVAIHWVSGHRGEYSVKVAQISEVS